MEHPNLDGTISSNIADKETTIRDLRIHASSLSGKNKAILMKTIAILKGNVPSATTMKPITLDFTLFSRNASDTSGPEYDRFKEDTIECFKKFQNHPYSTEETNIQLEGQSTEKFFNLDNGNYNDSEELKSSLSVIGALVVRVDEGYHLSGTVEIVITKNEGKLLVRHGYDFWIIHPLKDVKLVQLKKYSIKVSLSSDDETDRTVFMIVPDKARLPLALRLKNVSNTPNSNRFNVERINYRVARSDEEATALLHSGDKLVFAYIFLSFCEESVIYASVVENWCLRFPKTLMIGVDASQCTATVKDANVDKVPMVAVYVDGQFIDAFKPDGIKNLVRWMIDWCRTTKNMAHYDLTKFVDPTASNVINCLNPQSMQNLLSRSIPVVSHVNEKVILNVTFIRAVHLYAIQVKGRGNLAPKQVKLFVNVPFTFDLHRAQNTEPVQTLDLSESSFEVLPFVKFQNVQNLQIFVENNMGGNDKTIINKLKIFGAPVNQE